MKTELRYIEQQVWRNEPDCYNGKNANGIKPRWMTSYPKEGECSEGSLLELNLDAFLFPPGSRIIIEIPCCPKCGESSDQREPNRRQGAWPPCQCGFSWGKWAKEKYA